MLKLSKANQRRVLYALIILLGIALDQFTKRLAVRYLMSRLTLPLWEGVLHLTYVENPGAAFGILRDHPWIFILFSSVAILVIGVYLFLGISYLSDKDESGLHPPIPLLTGIALALVTSGGIGNMIDRIALGYVVDFIDFTLIDFAVFNVADSFVTVGAALLITDLLRSLFKMRGKRTEEK